MDQNQQPQQEFPPQQPEQSTPEYQPPGVSAASEIPAVTQTQTQQQQYQPQPQTQSALLPTGNKPALIGYYMGFVGFLPFIGLPFAIAAIVLGIKGLQQHKVTPVPGGKGHALTGLILGIVEVTFFVLFMSLVGLASLA
jgi:hypothetical protein